MYYEEYLEETLELTRIEYAVWSDEWRRKNSVLLVPNALKEKEQKRIINLFKLERTHTDTEWNSIEYRLFHRKAAEPKPNKPCLFKL